MPQTLSPSHTQQLSGTVDEHWLDRAIEDKLGEVIDKYRAQGQPVNSVGALRIRVAADINGLRGGAGWAALKHRYDPTPTVVLAWCTACDKPLSRGGVSAWLEDTRGWVFCSIECQQDDKRHPIPFSEFKRRVRDNGEVSSNRLDIVQGQLVLGEKITVTWDQIKDQGNPIDDSISVIKPDDEIIWD